jgi:hypothetical protein
MKQLKDIPSEVLWVWNVQLSTPFVGLETMNKINEIIDKNPEYFKWEHKYKSIPEEVHEAFNKECYPERFEPIQFEEFKGESLLSQISKSIERKPITYQGMVDSLQMYCDNKNKELRKEQERIAREKKIWNKHYSKFGLEYREN